MIVKPNIATPHADRARMYDNRRIDGDRAEMCATKTHFSKKAIARQRAAEIAKVSGQPFQAYHCQVHHCWHVGHPLGWRGANGNPTPS